jgi:preprotein translocase subunit SecD
MSKKRVFIIIIIILVLAILAGILDYPKYFNQGVDFFNSKIKIFKIPHFPNISFKLGLDLQGGSHLVYEADLSQIGNKDKGEAMSGLRDVIERRVNFFGVTEPVVQVQNERLIVELAGIKDVNEAIKMIGQTPYLEFKEELTTEERSRAFQEILGDKAKDIPIETACQNATFISQVILAYGQDPCFKPTSLNGQYLKSAELGFEQQTPKPVVLIEFNDEGAKLFADLTEKNIGKPLAIYIDQVPISIPVVQEKIPSGKAQITGSFTVEEAKELARNLNAGALPVPIKLISQQSVGPILGKLSLDKSLKAGIFGLMAVILFMVIFYRLPGVIASFALIIYVGLILSLFKLIPVTLTLSGIAGFILSIGMAVDANILIFSRTREEMSQGKNFSMAIEEGFNRAWPSIRDSNLNSLIVCFILFSVATSFIKGFALTLGIGVLVSMFSAIFITRIFLRVFIDTKLERFKWLW